MASLLGSGFADFAAAADPVVVIMSCAEDGDKPVWRYTTAPPPADWAAVKFNDSKWSEGPAGFGTPKTPGARVATSWETGQIWLRRSFTLYKNQRVGSFILRIHHDDEAVVFINGNPVGRFKGYETGYVDRPLPPQVLQILKPGMNSIAVSCLQKSGGQFIDVGIIDRNPTR